MILTIRSVLEGNIPIFQLFSGVIGYIVKSKNRQVFATPISRVRRGSSRQGAGLTGPIDTGIDFYRQVLNLRSFRQQVLSADIANASTPGFKAVDVDFKQAMAAVASPQSAAPGETGPIWRVSDARHMTPSGGGTDASGAVASAVKYQIGSAVTLDGNSVDLNQEKVAAAENAVDYEAATTFTIQTIKMLMTAINGSSSSSGG
jgi:flagellar basal-body rod protein FlgB